MVTIWLQDFLLRKKICNLLDDFVQNDYLKNNKNFELIFNYDSELSGSAINKNLYNEINKLAPFGNGNTLPTFLIKNVKIIRSRLVGENHINSIIKPNIGPSINTICFDCANSEIGDYLLSYKKKISIIAHIIDNSFNNKKSIQLNIKDLFLSVNSA